MNAPTLAPIGYDAPGQTPEQRERADKAERARARVVAALTPHLAGCARLPFDPRFWNPIAEALDAFDGALCEWVEAGGVVHPDAGNEVLRVVRATVAEWWSYRRGMEAAA